MKFTYLLTTIGKTKKEVCAILQNLNLNGEVLVGNQNSNDSRIEKFVFQGMSVTIYFLEGKGVSKNRNFLLREACGDYVTFLDDDVSLRRGAQSHMQDIVLSGANYEAHRFNLVSQNASRPIKQIHKDGPLKFSELLNFGVWGIFFDRKFLIENHIFFDENIGPGRLINHGEDFIFLKDFSKKESIHQSDFCGFEVGQVESTWTGPKNRDIIKEAFSQGYLYKRAFGCCYLFLLLFHFIKHRNNYNRPVIFLIKIARRGAKLYKISKHSFVDIESKQIELTKQFYE